MPRVSIAMVTDCPDWEILEFRAPVQFTTVYSSELNLIESALSKLAASSRVKVVRGPNRILLTPIGEGFPIQVTQLGETELLLEFGGWHEAGLPRDSIISLIDRSLTGRLRLIDAYVGKRPLRHTIEIMAEDGSWCVLGHIGYVRFPFFRTKPRHRIRMFGVDEKSV